MAKFSLTYPLLTFTLLAASSCSQEEPGNPSYDYDSRQIIFRADFPTVTSRAEIIFNTLPYFRVTAFNPADNSLLTDGVMEPHFGYERIDINQDSERYYSKRCLWPEQGRESDQVTFFAFYPELYAGAELTNNSSATKIDYKLKNFSVNREISSQVDFVTAYAAGKMADDMFKGVTLHFGHQLSRIEVKAWSANKSCDIEIAGIRFGGVGVKGTFAFDTTDGGGAWEDAQTERGIAEYIFREGDYIVSLPNVRSGASTTASGGAVSVMGAKVGDDENCAMLIPSTYTEWDAAEDRRNSSNNTFISVLLRITDATPSSGIYPVDPQRYPYRDLSQGIDSPNVPVIYMAVDKTSGAVISRLYKDAAAGKDDNVYYSDESCNNLFSIPDNVEVREYGWAAIPISAKWEPGKIYTYTLDYTSGIGLLGPEVDTTSPQAGDPVISDKVGYDFTVKDWLPGGGDEFIVPGS